MAQPVIWRDLDENYQPRRFRFVQAPENVQRARRPNDAYLLYRKMISASVIFHWIATWTNAFASRQQFQFAPPGTREFTSSVTDLTLLY